VKTVASFGAGQKWLLVEPMASPKSVRKGAPQCRVNGTCDAYE
jgi:hypothetical protein